ncbi:hypothetical protein K3495_g9292 [Podosphaera aphanis]|nr:hypothetical protein K3495_g9292 [Podosphaera aphanis]
MLPTPGSSLKQLWYRWKALKLPWRKQYLVGLDLQGNTFWEFRDSLSSPLNRMRRIVKFSQPTIHYSEVQISPQWHQWLRHTRTNPPCLAEQSQDILRQEQLKILAAAADARWTTESGKHSLASPVQDMSSCLPLKGDDTNISSSNAKGIDSFQVATLCTGVESTSVGTTTTTSPRMSELSNYGSDQVTSPHSRSDSTKKTEQKDSWKPASRRTSEEWKPQTWDGNLTNRR